MSLELKEENECREALEALGNLLTSIRVPYNDNLGAGARKAAVAKGDHQVDMLNDTFLKLASDIKKDRNCYVPVNRLIDELLIEIWSYIELRDRFLASQVCSRWHRVAMSATSLWGLLDMEDNKVTHLQHLLERSGTSPLHIVVGMKKLASGNGIAYFGPHTYPTSFKHHNNRMLNPHRPPSLVTPGFSPEGLSSTQLPFLTQKVFDQFVGRSATLDAIVDNSNSYYVSTQSAALKTPMPYLKTLRLIQGNGSPMTMSDYPQLLPQFGQNVITNNISPESLPFPLFGNHTPLLQELCFDSISPRWEDPIYRNLTNLRLNKLHNKATITQILRILQTCPKMTDLELTRCLVEGSSVTPQGTSEVTAPDATRLDKHLMVSLPHLKFFYFEELDHTSATSLLSSLALPQLEYLYIDTIGLVGPRTGPRPVDTSETYLIDPFGRPLKSIAETIRNPTYLCVDLQWGHISFSALSPVHNCDTTQPLKRTSPYIGGSGYGPLIPMVPPYGTPVQPRKKINEDEGSMWTITVPTRQPGFNRPINRKRPLRRSRLTNVASPGPSGTSPQPLVDSDISDNETVHTKSGPIRQDLFEVFENAQLGGLQFRNIKKLQLDLSSNIPNFFYHDLLIRCSGVRKFKATYHSGVSLLAEIVKDELFPMLEEVYLDGITGLGFGGAHIDPDPDTLVNWTEARQRRADLQQEHLGGGSVTTPVGLGEFGIHRLKKLVVQFQHMPPVVLSTDNRKRLEDALGKDGEFIWRSTSDRWMELQNRWTTLLENDGESRSADPATSLNTDHAANMDADADGDKTINTGEKVKDVHISAERFADNLTEEWSLGGNRGMHQGWSAGPW